jgi:hypothetical protein
VETGLLPLNLAIDISKTDAEGGQRALMDAYTQKKLRGKKLAAVRRLIQQRDAQGPHLHRNRYGRSDGGSNCHDRRHDIILSGTLSQAVNELGFAASVITL